MIKVYLWNMTTSRWGHLSLELSDGTYISFWPKETRGFKKASLGTSYESDVKSEGSSADDILELPDDIVDQEEIKSWWKDYVLNNQYSLVFNNCAQVVKEALVKGGIAKYMDEETTRAYVTATTPLQVYVWAASCRRNYIVSQMETPSDKTCQLL
ncbi:hypothetical protein C0J52_06048 [Blattella germanica]|nr:hypothetical protein C0J52_06048 [Blattella germanica]